MGYQQESEFSMRRSQNWPKTRKGRIGKDLERHMGKWDVRGLTCELAAFSTFVLLSSLPDHSNQCYLFMKLFSNFSFAPKYPAPVNLILWMCNLLSDLNWTSKWAGDTHTCTGGPGSRHGHWMDQGAMGICEWGCSGECRECGCVSDHLGISVLFSWRQGAGLHSLNLHYVSFLIEFRVLWQSGWLALLVSSVCAMLVQDTWEHKNPAGSRECTWMDFKSQKQQTPGTRDVWIQHLSEDA